MKLVITAILLAALFALGHGAWHTAMNAAGNGITAAVTGSP